MLCPVCYGKHVVTLDGRQLPCPECAGAGEVHCCDGLQEQPGRPAPAIDPCDSNEPSQEDSA
jgi:hypothetical protein